MWGLCIVDEKTMRITKNVNVNIKIVMGFIDRLALLNSARFVEKIDEM
jgi:ArsR family metal-binding transcriptional regulator